MEQEVVECIKLYSFFIFSTIDYPNTYKKMICLNFEGSHGPRNKINRKEQHVVANKFTIRL